MTNDERDPVATVKPHRNRATVIALLVWVAVVSLFSIDVLFGTAERGSGMDGILLILLAVFGGGASLIAAMLAIIPVGKRRGPWPLLIRLVVAASFFSLIGVVRYGGYLYRIDQEEAKRFVERRIAAVRAADANSSFPATQEEFVAGQPLPRLLRNQKFYFHDGGSDFHIEIRVDFDGGWNYSSRRPEWMSST